MASQNQWLEADVHAWTNRMRIIMQTQMPFLPGETERALLVNLMPDLCKHQVFTQIVSAFRIIVAIKWPSDLQAVNRVLDKLIARVDIRDPEFFNCYPAGLFILLMKTADSIEPALDALKDENKHEDDIRNIISKDGPWREVKDVLVDTGGTCIQGDTHRMFATLLAFIRDQRDINRMLEKKDTSMIVENQKLQPNFLTEMLKKSEDLINKNSDHSNQINTLQNSSIIKPAVSMIITPDMLPPSRFIDPLAVSIGQYKKQ